MTDRRRPQPGRRRGEAARIPGRGSGKPCCQGGFFPPGAVPAGALNRTAPAPVSTGMTTERRTARLRNETALGVYVIAWDSALPHAGRCTVFWEESRPAPEFSYHSHTLGRPTPPQPVSGVLGWSPPPPGQPAKKTMKQLWDKVQEFADRLENPDAEEENAAETRQPGRSPGPATSPVRPGRPQTPGRAR